LVDDSRESEVITKNAEQVIANAQAAIAKAQAFIQVNEQKLCCCQEKARGARGCQEADQEDLTARSSKLESLQAQLAAKKFLS